MSEWQPIETAPRDGEEFLGWLGGDANVHEICYWSAPDDCWCNSYGWHLDAKLTHWMPLPEPPQMTLDTPPENGG